MNQRTITVAVIEQEPTAAAAIARTLEAGGLAVRTASTADGGLRLALASDVDLVVLDLLLADRTGAGLLAELAARRPGLPVVVLDGRDRVADRIEALRAGAVDHLAKPFALAELEARVHAQLRTARPQALMSLKLGSVTLDFVTRRVTHPGGEVHLSNREFDLLGYLARNRGEVVGRDQIRQAVWGYLHDPGTNVVDVYVGYLRRKLQTADGPLLTITTVRSRGYRLERPASVRAAAPVRRIGAPAAA